jgi:hypothetical protein
MMNADASSLCGLEGCPVDHDGGAPLMAFAARPLELSSLASPFVEFRVCADHRAAIAEVSELQAAVQRLTT